MSDEHKPAADMELYDLLQEVEYKVYRYLDEHYRLGWWVEFDHGRSRLRGQIVEFGRYWDLGRIRVRVKSARSKKGCYFKWVSPAGLGNVTVVNKGGER